MKDKLYEVLEEHQSQLNLKFNLFSPRTYLYWIYRNN